MEWVSSDDITVKAEEEVFKGIVKWVSHNKSEREVEFPALLHQIRLASIPHDFLLNILVKEELVAKSNVCLHFVLDGMRLMASATDEQTVQQPRKCLKMNADAIFVCGGILKRQLYASDESEDCGTYMYTYNPEKNCSYKLDKPLISHHKACVVNDEKYLYLIGGANRRGASVSTTYRCDPSADDHEWEEVAPINQARYNAFGAAMNGKVYIAGGCQGQVTLDTCEVYNPVTNEWQLMPSLNLPRKSASMVCFEGRLYVLGGVSHTLNFSHKWSRVLSVETFDSEQNIWEEKSDIPVNSFETSKEKEKNKFRACSARLHKEVIDKPEPLELSLFSSLLSLGFA
ncbi:kelch-like protein 3 [Orbicella faveolata]|uniref:kelch-like protein 3 n=1 Tax=Orbicella faveolata TaxID=48498 RepID=UPI0009E48B29|nr:kelch-like protein 3 [Orbicella faveolata]